VKKNLTLEKIKWVDTHCHLQLMGGQINEDELHNLEYLIIPGVNVQTSVQARDVSNSLIKKSFWSAGLHPHEADSFFVVKQDLYKLMQKGDLIGETGLDYYRNLSSRENQIKSLMFHFEIAEALNKPIILHCRDSFSDLFSILNENQFKIPIILHSWTGGNNWTKKFRELGVYFSISGIVTYATAHDIQSAVSKIPLDKLLLETDIPYLAPEPFKGKTNHPTYIMYTAEKLSQLLDISLPELSKITISNTDKMLSGL